MKFYAEGELCVGFNFPNNMQEFLLCAPPNFEQAAPLVASQRRLIVNEHDVELVKGIRVFSMLPISEAARTAWGPPGRFSLVQLF